MIFHISNKNTNNTTLRKLEIITTIIESQIENNNLPFELVKLSS